MGQVTEDAYTKLIEENISELEKYMPEHSLEKRHTIEVLRWSIGQFYPPDKPAEQRRCNCHF